MKVWIAGWFVLLSPLLVSAQVDFDQLRNPSKNPANWVTYSGDLQGHRYSPLAEITSANISRLKVRWAYQLPVPDNEVSTRPPPLTLIPAAHMLT